MLFVGELRRGLGSSSMISVPSSANCRSRPYLSSNRGAVGVMRGVDPDGIPMRCGGVGVPCKLSWPVESSGRPLSLSSCF